MAQTSLSTPIALIHFKRPDKTARVFERIRAARPQRLILLGDAPADESQAEAVEATRRVVSEIDWPCEVVRDYPDRQLGMKARVSSAIDRVFSEAEEAIILEDDTVPHPSFFRYCEELLDRYRDDDRVMHIGGSLLLDGPAGNGASYHFSRYVHIWGWAGWRRAWQHYDVDMRSWHDLSRRRRERRLRELFDTEDERRYWRFVWDNSREIDNWDAQWSYALLSRGGVSVVPNSNLITNVGFGPDANTATRDVHGIGGRPLQGMSFPMTHPHAVAADEEADLRACRLFKLPDPNRDRPSLGRRVWNAALRAGGRALDFVPEPIRPRIRHRDRPGS